MNCPHCHLRIPPEIAAKALGSLGGATTGKSKIRQVDYRELARLSHLRRAENKAKTKE